MRVRKTSCNITGKQFCELTIKKLVSNNDNIKAFDEITIHLDSIENGINFLKSLDFIQTTYVSKIRQSFKYDECLFEFDILTEKNIIKSYLEIESDSEQNVNKALKKLNIMHIQ